ncbi:MAG: hypothetical protein GX442_19390 [Candidatus Riflebacteria bacterium]|nr:hypothetical protein [Candidatus Riflebacteria bacterium]
MPRQRGSSPKLVLWNNALVNALSTRAFDEARRDRAWWSRLVENAAGSHLCCGLPPVEYPDSCWRDGPHEVDDVVTRGPALWAFEAKSGRGGRQSGLTRFQDRYPEAKVLLIGSTGIPLEEFRGHQPGERMT